MFNCLLDVVDSGVVSNVQSGSTTPGGYSTLGNNTTLTIIGIVILLILLSITVLIIYKIIKSGKSTLNDDISNEEKQLVSEYRKLTSKEKKVINDTIKTLNKTKYL